MTVALAICVLFGAFVYCLFCYMADGRWPWDGEL